MTQKRIKHKFNQGERIVLDSQFAKMDTSATLSPQYDGVWRIRALCESAIAQSNSQNFSKKLNTLLTNADYVLL